MDYLGGHNEIINIRKEARSQRTRQWGNRSTGWSGVGHKPPKASSL